MQKETLAYVVGALVMLVWQIVVTPWAATLPSTSKAAIIVRFLHCGWKAIEAVRASQKDGDVLHAMTPTDTTCASTSRNVYSGCVKGKGMIAGLLVVLLCVGCVRSGKDPCTAYAERSYWFGGSAKFYGALAIAASGTAIPVQGDKERTALAVGAATTGATSLALWWLADSARTSHDEECRKEPVK